MMEDERSARREVISWEVMLVLAVRRRKSLNHCGEAWRGEIGDNMGLGLEGGDSSGKRFAGYGVSVVDGLSDGWVNAAEA